MPQNQETTLYTKNNPYAYTTGSVNAYETNQSGPTYFDGQELTFRANTTNTGASTLNIQNRGAIPLKKEFNADLDAGDIQAGQIINVRYDSANNVFQVIGGIGGTGEANAGVNLGSGADVYKGKTGLNLEFRSLTSQGVKAFEDGDEIKINAPYVTVGTSLTRTDYLNVQDAIDDGHTNIVLYNEAGGIIQDNQIDFSGGASNIYHIYGMNAPSFDLRFNTTSGTGGQYINAGDKSVYFHNVNISVSLNLTYETFFLANSGLDNPVVFDNCQFTVGSANTGNKKYLFNWTKGIGSGCFNCKFSFINPFLDLVWMSRNNVGSYSWAGGTDYISGVTFYNCNISGGSVMLGDEIGNALFDRCQYISEYRGGITRGFYRNCNIKFASGTVESSAGDGTAGGIEVWSFDNCYFDIDTSAGTLIIDGEDFDIYGCKDSYVNARNMNYRLLVSEDDFVPYLTGFSGSHFITTGDLNLGNSDYAEIIGNTLEVGDVDASGSVGHRIIGNRFIQSGALTRVLFIEGILEGNNFNASSIGIGSDENVISCNRFDGTAISGTGDNNVITGNTNLGSTAGMTGVGNIIANNT